MLTPSSFLDLIYFYIYNENVHPAFTINDSNNKTNRIKEPTGLLIHVKQENQQVKELKGH